MFLRTILRNRKHILISQFNGQCRDLIDPFSCVLALASSPKKRLLPFSGELGKIKAGSLCSAERIYILALFCRTHLHTKLVLQNTQKSRWLYIIRHDNVRIMGQIRSSLCSSLFRPFQQPFFRSAKRGPCSKLPTCIPS